ncbi:hypothetical protein R1T40_19345 [Tritonibacter scottomollicae]|uniref:Uncharacterized protein n=1 Tax=Tritonibacter scottomollicae TaxID=483013 RepID=A0ABZ0HFN6_TRISK|nr:hypothetical protein [Tritonibacter scottomollicae]WOI33066.1 hypothetical protein R1T40_19345 [Tritonibacter scottomollicae]
MKKKGFFALGLVSTGALGLLLWGQSFSNVHGQGVTRVSPTSLQCDFDGYDGIFRHDEASKDERGTYALSMGYTNFGGKDIHDKMRSDFLNLTFDPKRAPIVSADLDTGLLHVFDCKAEHCTREEIARDAPEACMRATGANSCMTFAVRVEGQFYCTLGPGLSQ